MLKTRYDCGAFEGRPEPVLFEWSLMGDETQYPEQAPIFVKAPGFLTISLPM